MELKSTKIEVRRDDYETDHEYQMAIGESYKEAKALLAEIKNIPFQYYCPEMQANCLNGIWSKNNFSCRCFYEATIEKIISILPYECCEFYTRPNCCIFEGIIKYASISNRF